VKKYCESILVQVENPICIISPERIEANLKMFCFLEKNKENLYVREASMLVYGDSKWFENNNYEEVCTFLRYAIGINREESERNDAVLGLFNVVPAEQEIFIKGDWQIEWEQYVLNTSKLSGGIAISSGDVYSIKMITVYNENVMTIENKTSYQRIKDRNYAMMYLGGFANRHQIEFLKKVILDNPNVKYLHFGDIDIGGFLIHKHLCRETSKNFEMYCMGIEQLKDVRFSHCLKEMTDNDMSRLESLIEDTTYSEILKYMKEHNVKLEQEIVSYYLGKEN
jgi:DNA topoisomerase VI subunit A